MISVAAILVSPALMFLSFFLWAYALWIARRAPASIAALAAGALLVMAPWQMHCYFATGAIQPTLLTSRFSNDVGVWSRSWMVRERDMRFRFRPKELCDAPRRAFSTSDEKSVLCAASRESTEAEFADQLRTVGLEAERQSPLRYHLILPFARAVNLWFDMPQIGHVQMEYVGLRPPDPLSRFRGVPPGRAWSRLIKGTLSTFTWLLYVAYPLIFLLAAVRALRERRVLPVLVFASVGLFSGVSAYFAHAESRRNLPFYPAMLFVVCRGAEFGFRRSDGMSPLLLSEHGGRL
jgi:hypothetical protein